MNLALSDKAGKFPRHVNWFDRTVWFMWALKFWAVWQLVHHYCWKMRNVCRCRAWRCPNSCCLLFWVIAAQPFGHLLLHLFTLPSAIWICNRIKNVCCSGCAGQAVSNSSFLALCNTILMHARRKAAASSHVFLLACISIVLQQCSQFA